MPQRYADAILKYLSTRGYQPLKPGQLARQMGVADEDYGTFRTSLKLLRDSGRVVLGAKDALMLPAMSSQVVGFFRGHERGFGFVIPEEANAHGDLYIPPESVGGAVTGDLVLAKVVTRARGGERIFHGVIVEILKRGRNRYVGTLERTKGTWFVVPDGTKMTSPIVVRDVGAAGPRPGSKVVAEIVQYAEAGKLPEGVIVESLGPQGTLQVETRSVICAYGLEQEFSESALADARAAIARFDPDRLDGREDLTDQVVVTIDPPDARDYDDAISLSAQRDGSVTLGVHIADVSNFVQPGTALDAEARRRATSVYFPRTVLPMLPEVLSNGVCSLQEGQKRFCQSAFLTYDASGRVLGTRVAETVIRSSRRLTYRQAQALCDGRDDGQPPTVARLVRQMEKLARAIERRRRQAGMLHLELPQVELVFDKQDHVVDVTPEDDSYTHTIIEMFMVEANEAVSRLLTEVNRPHLRRIHPAPDAAGGKQFQSFVRALGHRLPRDLSRRDLQELLERVKGRPESFAVNLAVLRSLQRAVYSPMQIGHYALASENYAHFTSPIRRYPDLTVHRLIREHCRGTLASRAPEDIAELIRLGQDCTAAEKRAEAAEDELRQVLLLQHLMSRVGEEFHGVITGVANFGIFVQLPRYLTDGLVRLGDLGDDWWEVSAPKGQVHGGRTGRTYRIGDVLPVRIAAVDVARRQLNLVPALQTKAAPAPAPGKPKEPKPPQSADREGRGRRRKRR